MSSSRSFLLALLAVSFTACEHGKSPNPGDSGAADSGAADTDTVDTADTDTIDTSVETGVIDTADTGCPDDLDCDGLNDDAEEVLGTDPDDWDSDDDNLSDLEEFRNRTDPHERDTDGDGIADGLDDDPGTANTPDNDGDGLPNALEDALGTYSELTDSDGDGLSDYDEVFGDTEPMDDDSDDDTLSDGAEVDAGTDPNDSDTDGDELDDGDEVYTHGTDPLLADSDGDTYDDDVELLAGTDPLDPTDVPGAGGGDVVLCEPTGVTELPGSAFYDGATNAGLAASEARALYVDWTLGDVDGAECSCQVVLADPTPVQPIGVSVWIPSRAHDGTQWSTNPLPAAVMLDVPANWSDTSRRFTNNTEEDVIEDDFGVDTIHWFAFDDISSNTDNDWTLNESAPIDVSGVYTIWVSYANVDHDSIESCDVLANATTPEDSLHFRVDVDTPPASPAPPVADGLACSPSTQAHTLFGLANLGVGTQALPLAGAPFIGAGAKEIRVTDWRGADRLELRHGPGLAVVLTPEHPVVHLQQPIPLAALRLRSGRATAGTWSDPVVDVVHTCPATSTQQVPGNVTTVAWSELDGALRAATGGIGLEVWRPGLDESDMPAVRARIESGGDGRPDHLVFEAAGGGRLDALVLARQGEGSWTFHHRAKGLTLDGALVATGNDLFLSLDEGLITVAGLPIPLAATSLLLVGGTSE